MKKLTYLFLFVVGVTLFSACRDQQTYADQKNRERAAINKYLVDSAVNVISEDQFKAQNYTTDVSKTQFVLFQSNGIYMQIVRKGSGRPIREGEHLRVLCRFTERNLLTDSVQVSNVLYPLYTRFVETMDIVNRSGTMTGSFDKTSSLMYTFYGTTTVPTGWLAPLTYLNIGRWDDTGHEIAKVRVIVPHDVGQSNAVSAVYPCLYDITYQRR